MHLDHERSFSLLHATVEAVADGVLVLDRAGRVLLFNQRLLSLWGLPELRGAPIDEEEIYALMLDRVEDPDDFRARLLDLEEESESTDVARLNDGRVIECHVCPQRVSEEIVGRVWSYRDISDRVRLLNRALFLSDATRLLASLDAERALDAVAHLAVPRIAEECTVDLLEQAGLHRSSTVSRFKQKRILSQVPQTVLSGHSSLFSVNSVSCIGVPLLAQDRILGAMMLAAPPQRPFSRDDVDLLEELGRRSALAIENARLFQQVRCALKVRDEFLSVAAHEIRGPTAAVHLAVQSLHRGELPPAAQHKLFEIIEREDRRLGQFVDELLDVSRIRSGTLRFDFERVDLGESVKQVSRRLEPELERAGSKISLDIEGGVQGEWDRFRIDQIVTNLLSNAIKFGLGKPISVRVSTDDSRAFITVSDRGIGIAPEVQERIFEAFERGVSVHHYGGLGLGLYIVKTLTQGMGGCVSVQSAQNRGSTFTVELPRARDE
jgi:PAS domain S-box-containing protein